MTTNEATKALRDRGFANAYPLDTWLSIDIGKAEVSRGLRHCRAVTVAASELVSDFQPELAEAGLEHRIHCLSHGEEYTFEISHDEGSRIHSETLNTEAKA